MENNSLDDFFYLTGDTPRLIYAGLGKRFMATLFDVGALFVILIIFFAILEIANAIFFNGLSLTSIEVFLICLVGLLYYPIMESYSQQGSLGKQYMNIKVIDSEENKLSLGLASARFVLKIFSCLFMFIGFIPIIFTKNKQGLHDIILGTYVVEK